MGVTHSFDLYHTSSDLVSWNEYDLPLFAEGLRNGNGSISRRYATEFGSEHGRQKLLLGFVV